ncbi:MAG TPA: transposase [Acidimicrobiales bacterium]|nr:transposase [Acidimicrobiales bacterium]
MAKSRAGQGNDVGVDPHKRTSTATVLDSRGAVMGTRSFSVSGDGHRQLETWATSHGRVRRWGIEGASGLGRHTTVFLVRHGHDVRDVNPDRTAEQSRKRRQGKTDALGSLRIARELQADPDMPVAFKRAQGDAGPDERSELLALWHKARRWVVDQRRQLLNQAESLLCELPEQARASLPDQPDARARLAALAKRDRSATWDAPTALRLRLLDAHTEALGALEALEREAAGALAGLVEQSGSTLDELCGLAQRSVAELLVEVGDPRRFAGEGGFARFNGTAPLPASSAEGDDEPVRHRLNRGGNRRVNAVIYRMAVTQKRCSPKPRPFITTPERVGIPKRESMRVLKRHLSNVIYRRMLRDLAQIEQPRSVHPSPEIFSQAS